MKVCKVVVPVLLLRLDHHGALGVVRSLGRLGVRVYGMHKSDDAPALSSRYARGGFVWDLDEEPPHRSVERLLSIAAELRGRPILVPTNDETALFVAAHAARLRPAFRFAENPENLVRSLYDKKKMYHLAKQLGIPTAETCFPKSREEARMLAATMQFPLMLKGSDGIRLSRRSGRRMVLVHDLVELMQEYDRLEDPAHPDLMLQEYIPGGEDSVWMFNGYFDANSECRFGITAKKLRQNPVYTGMSSLAECRRNDEVDRLTRRFMKELGYRGILDIGYRFDERDGRYKVLDVNPRLGATFRLFVDDENLDVARAMYLDLTGQPIRAGKPREGRRWVVEDLDVASSVRYQRDGVLTAGEWLRSFRGVEEGAWFASDDLRPFLQMCGRLATRAGRKLGKTLGLVPTVTPEQQDRELVTRHFGQAAIEWQRVYHQDQLEPLIYRERHATALRWVDALPLPSSAQVLDVGCGAGHTAVEIARRGHRVHALDATPEMIALALESAMQAGVPFLTAEVGDAHALEFGDGSFDLVVALGLLPWLRSEQRGLREMARVLKPGGFLITTADHRAPLHRLLDPRATPTLAPLRGAARQMLGRPRRYDGPLAKKHAPATVDGLIRSAGLEKVDSVSVGFGPFSMMGRRLFSDRGDVKVHARLQELAHREWPVLRSTGAHYLVLARKPAA